MFLIHYSLNLNIELGLKRIEKTKRMKKKERKKCSKKRYNSNEINLRLNTYEDMFSSFDPRHYSERSLSQDFLDESKRAARDLNENELELILLIPKEKRNFEQEGVIKKRLKDHFKKHAEQLKIESRKTLYKGIALTLFGLFLMSIATMILFNNGKNLSYSLLVIWIEPASWFMVWYGLDIIFYMRNKIELEFYQKMAKAEIRFYSS